MPKSTRLSDCSQDRGGVMDARRFHNALRVLLNLTPRQLAEAGVIDANWGSAEASDRDPVIAFMDNPFREAIRMPDANFDQLYALIESRQPDAPRDAVIEKAAAFFAHLEGARSAGKDWWAETLMRLLEEQVQQCRLLKRAEAFISGFEDDETNSGVAELLEGIRATIKTAEVA